MLLTAVALIPVLIWIYLLGARGGFWRVPKHFAIGPTPDITNKRVCVVIPARNEASGIGAAVASLLEQNFPTPLRILLVDDGSTDNTAEIARLTAERAGKTAQLTILSGQRLAAGWTGKLWALSQGIERAEEFAPDFLLFTDADIRHGRNSIAELIAIAEAGQYDLASYMVRLACVTTAEKALIPAFVFFFLKLYPPAWVRSPRRKTAGAAGGCILIRPQALRAIGGIQVIRGEMIDDCSLARAVKRNRGRIWLGLTPDTESIRSYGTFADIGHMISRTAFSQLQHSGWLLIGTLIGLFLCYVLPVVLLFTGRPLPALLGAIAWLLMSFCYLPMVRFYGQSTAWSFSLPLIAAFYAGATVHSALQYWRGRGGEWKGRIQDVVNRP